MVYKAYIWQIVLSNLYDTLVHVQIGLVFLPAICI